MTAGETLQLALRDALEAGEVIPCAGGSQWLSERHEDRKEAAALCQPCPVLALCHAFASTARPRLSFGTFAGIDYTSRQIHREKP